MVDVPIVEGRPDFNPLPGGEIVSAYTYFPLGGDWELDGVSLDFSTLNDINQPLIHNIMDQVNNAMGLDGQTIVGYTLWRGSVTNVDVPDELCFDIPVIGNQCITVPGGGTVVASAHHYRLSLVYIPTPRGSAVRPIVWTAGAVIWAIIAATVAVVVIIGAWGFVNGKIPYAQLVGAAQAIGRIPGESVSGVVGSFSWPFMALGFSLVAASIALPFIQSHAEAKFPLGPGGSVTVGGSAGTRK